MSIWIFRIAAIFGLGLLALPGCLKTPDVARAGIGFARSAPQSIAVAQSSVVIAGPPGYCIDKSGSRLSGENVFVLLGSCAAIARTSDAGTPHRHGLLTASVTREPTDGPGVLADIVALERYIASPAGRAALARDMKPDSVEILATMRDKDALLIRLRDSSQGDISGMDHTYWRGLTDLNGRLVAVSVVSFADRPLGKDEGLATLRTFLARIRAETLSQSSDI